jgi:Tol biopolymer transport system component
MRPHRERGGSRAGGIASWDPSPWARMPSGLPLLPGSRLGAYEIVAPLGAGGMGEVFRARDARLGREVALKLLPPAFADDPDRLARFEREARVLAALSHPGIAHLYGLEEADAQPFLVLELAEGEDLSARIGRGRLPVDEAVAVARQVAEALEAAHEKGIVHRDLKPANVKVGADGQVKVLDFGLAKAWTGEAAGVVSGSGALSQSPTLAHGGTEAGLLLGTAAYMSPEQARGKPVDKRADVWAWGAVLFEMLTGRRLFEGETITDVLAAVVRQDIDWEALPAETPPRVRRLLHRCLERDPKLRLRDIGEARIALLAPEETTPAATAPAGLSRRAAAGLVAGAAGGAFALGYGLGRRMAAAGGGAADASVARLSVSRITSSGNVTEAAISPDGRFVAYVESEQGQQTLWLRQVATGQTIRLIPERPVYFWGHTFTRDGNSIVYGLKSPEDIDGAFYSISTLGGSPRRLVSGVDSAPAFSPDGARMAWTRARHPTPGESALLVANADGTGPRVVARVAEPERLAPVFFNAPDWSPDGHRIACSVVRVAGGPLERGGKVIAVSVDGGAVETLAEPGWRFAAQVAWLPDGRGLLVVAAAEGEPNPGVWLVPLPRGAPRRVTVDVLEYRIVSLTADGSSFLTVASDALATVWLQARDGVGRPRRLTSSKVDGLYGLDFTPDGRIVYTSLDAGQGGLWVTSPQTGDRSPLPIAEGGLRSPVVTRSGRIFYLSRGRSRAEIRQVVPDGSASRVVASGVTDDGFAVSPDERVVVFSAIRDGETRLLRVDASGGEPVTLTDYPAFTPAFSPDGTRLAFYYIDRATKRFRIGIMKEAGGALERSLEAEPPASGSRILFRDEGLYLNTMPRDRANVWLVPLDGRPPRRLTDFQDFILYGFAVSPDGKSLAYSRGPRTRDALLVRGFR